MVRHMDILAEEMLELRERDPARYKRLIQEGMLPFSEVRVLDINSEQFGVPIDALMKICYEHNIPVTTRGAGTGLVGGCTPVCGGVVLCTMVMPYSFSALLR